MKLQEANIAEKILEICNEILEYENGEYHYNVIVTSGGEVIRGDLHIDGNSWTEFSEDNIIAQFNVHACDIKQMIEGDGNDPDDVEQIEIYEDENRQAHKKFSENMANAIVNGLPIEDIRPEIVW